MKVYKVKHIPSGLYWKGGGVPTYKKFMLTGLGQDEIEEKTLKLKFSKKGKTWNQLNHVNSALSGSKTDRLMKNILDNCVTEVYELVKIEEL